MVKMQKHRCLEAVDDVQGVTNAVMTAFRKESSNGGATPLPLALQQGLAL